MEGILGNEVKLLSSIIPSPLGEGSVWSESHISDRMHIVAATPWLAAVLHAPNTTRGLRDKVESASHFQACTVVYICSLL